MMKKYTNLMGYTLIEVIIALAIFAILSTITVGVLSRSFDINSRLSNQIEPLTELALASTRITQSATQIIARPVRSQKMTKIPDFIANTDQIEFTRGGFLENNTPPVTQSTLRRMALRCEDKKLVQIIWPTLDGFDATLPQKQILLSHLKSCQFSFPASHKTWSDSWRGDENITPAAFQLHLNIKNLGYISLVFHIPGGTEID